MSDNSGIAERIRLNWQTVCDEISRAAESCGRDPAEICVIGVTKYVDAAMTQQLVDAGCSDLGENRPQVLWQKAEELAGQDLCWHMIGHVQTNKLRRLMRYRPLIHSVDSERLLLAISNESISQDRQTDVLLEVNISGDANKTGMHVDDVHRLVARKEITAVNIRGLMAMAGRSANAEEIESQFRSVARLRDELQQACGRPLSELSMGMSGDYQQAIAAGATMVRIGSAIFQGVI